jgi:hypothetical protein
MFDNAAREFLKKPLTARMSVNDPDGYPHTVPVWFMLDGDDIVIISPRKTRKVGFLKADAKGAVTIGGDPADGGGYLIKGEFVIEEDPGNAWMKKMTYYYEPTEQAEKDIAEWVSLDIIVLRLKPKWVAKVA